MDIIKKEFGKYLKRYRKDKNFTQEKLAENIGVNLRQLARIEAGESFVSSKTLYNICSTLKISPSMLFDYEITEHALIPKTENNISDNTNKDFDNFVQKIHKISDDRMKLEFMEVAYKALSDKNALKELKLMIKGIELTQH